MSSRHTRRKAAKAKREAKTIDLAEAYRSHVIAETVKANKRSPIERNYYPTRSCVADLAGSSHRAHICQNAQGVVRTGQALSEGQRTYKRWANK